MNTIACLTNIVGYIKGSMFYAHKRGLLEQNPMDLVDIKPIKEFCITCSMSRRSKDAGIDTRRN